MRLIKQTRLHYQAGKSDKVYEVDLCAVGDETYAVNFRYGRRGTHLRDGTKTRQPVDRNRAEALFDDLVDSKVRKGYVVVADGGGGAPEVPQEAATPAAAPGIEAAPGGDPRIPAILQRLRRGDDSESRWSLNRAMWRAGEMGVAEAVPLLIPWLSRGDALRRYSAAWALGRCLDQSRRRQEEPPERQQAVSALDQAWRQASNPAVRRITVEALLLSADPEQRRRLSHELRQGLPAELLENPADFFAQVAAGGPDDDRWTGLYDLYLQPDPSLRQALLAVLSSLTVSRGALRPLRWTIKAAELRRDARVYGLLNLRFEDAGAGGGLSPASRNYWRRRVWRALQRLGDLGHEDFVKLASGVLLAVTDNDGVEPYVLRHEHYDYRRRRWQTTETHVDRYCKYFAFNHLLYAKSPRYELSGRGLSFICKAGYRPGQGPPREREEAFPELWDAHPDALIALLFDSACQEVHVFAVRALGQQHDFLRRLELAAVIRLLGRPYEATAAFAFELARQRYDPEAPDAGLLVALANCPYEPARRAGHAWIEAAVDRLLEETSFAVALVLSPQADTRALAKRLVAGQRLDARWRQAFLARVLSVLNDPQFEITDAVADTGHLLVDAFRHELATLGLAVVTDLLAHPLAEVQELAARILQNHGEFLRRPDPEILARLLESDQPTVRELGAGVLSRLSDFQLLERTALLLSLLSHRLPDLRQAIRPTVARLAAQRRDFRAELVVFALEMLLNPRAAEGVHDELNRLLLDELSDSLGGVPEDTIWRLLRSRSTAAQEVGGELLAKIDAQKIDMRRIVELASHDVASVRRAAWSMFEADVARVKRELPQAVRIMDAAWEDSRRFAADFLSEHLDPKDFTPQALISVCDSTRPDVQHYGRQLIQRNFQEEAGPEYLMKLSEHPAAGMQMFVAGLLAQYAGGQPRRIAELEPFFRSSLARVNRGRVTKDRIFDFFETELEKDQGSARVIARVLATMSATLAKGDKARAVRLLLKLKVSYPELEVPLAVTPVEVRRAV